MNRIVHFEIMADDPARAAKFYTDTFGWEIKKWENAGGDYWLVNTGKDEAGKWPGINGGLMQRKIPITGEGVIAFVCTIDVENVDEMLAKVTTNGGTLAVAKVEVPQMGWLVYCKDTEGNMFGMMQAVTPNAEPQA